MGALAAQPPANEAHRRVVLGALERSQGRVTVGDMVAKTGLGRDEAEGALRSLLSTHEGHLEVSDEGELIYLFDPSLAARDERSGWEKFKAASWRGFKAGFKVWIMLMLVVYFVVYVVLALAAFAALMANDRNGGGGSRRSSSGGGLPIWWLLYMFWTPDWRYGRSHYYGDTYDWRGQRKPREQKVPFYLKVFAFVFGPEEPQEDPLERDQRVAAWIRSRLGVVTTAELVEFSGLPYAEADSEMARLLGAFNGEAHITEEGEVVYSFKELMLSAQQDAAVARGEAPPAWRKLERPRKLTGNKARDNWIVGFFNGFNLLFAMISPFIIFPILQIRGTGAMVGLVIVPLIFSLLFFAVPAVRSVVVRRENRQRHARNVRKLLLKGVFGSAREHKPMNPDAARSDVERGLGEVETKGDPQAFETQLSAVSAELEAEVEEGGRRLRFPIVERALEESETVRQGMRLDQQQLGEIVFGTADDERQAGERELRDFERGLEGSGPGGEASWEQQQELEAWKREQLGEQQDASQVEREEEESSSRRRR